MIRRRALRFGIVLAPALALVVSVAYLALTVPPSQSPQGPPARTPALAVSFPVTSYLGSRIWYNFTVTAEASNVSWASVQFGVEPGPLTKAATNWSLGVWNAAGDLVAPHQSDSQNWTTVSAAPVVSGESVVLETDSPLTFGSLWAEWPTVGPGAWGVEID